MMSENIIWVYNGWAVLITCLGPLYSLIDTYARLSAHTFILRSAFPAFALSSIVLLVLLSHWLTAVLYLPVYLLLSVIVAALKNVVEALIGRRRWDEV